MDFENSLVMIRQIGAGSYSKVYLAKDKFSAKNYAVKKLLYCQSDIEWMVLQKMRYHPHIVEFYDTFVENDTRFLVMEHCYTNLSDYIIKYQQIPDFQITVLFQQLLSAVDALHTIGISHRDLKPENCLLTWTTTKPVLKLADFGLSTTESRVNNYGCGSKRYMSYECYNRPTNRNIGYEAWCSDIWSCGIILLNLITRKCPWERPTFDDSYFRFHMHGHERDSFTTVFKVTTNLAKILRKTFSLIPKSRPTATNLSLLIYSLQHNYRQETVYI